MCGVWRAGNTRTRTHTHPHYPPSHSVEANLEHMWKRYGFYLPDAAYVADPEGLLSYLGSKIANGRVALYTRGDDDTARVHPSLHAVQRHMVDTAQVRREGESEGGTEG